MASNDFILRFQGKASSISKLGMRDVVGKAGNPVEKKGWQEFLGGLDEDRQKQKEKQIKKELKQLKKFERKLLPKLKNSRMMKQYPKRSGKDLAKMRNFVDQEADRAFLTESTHTSQLGGGARHNDRFGRRSPFGERVVGSDFFSTPHSLHKGTQRLREAKRHLNSINETHNRKFVAVAFKSPFLANSSHNSQTLSTSSKMNKSVKAKSNAKVYRSQFAANSPSRLVSQSGRDDGYSRRPRGLKASKSSVFMSQASNNLLINSSPSIRDKRQMYLRGHLPSTDTSNRSSFNIKKRQHQFEFDFGNH